MSLTRTIALLLFSLVWAVLFYIASVAVIYSIASVWLRAIALLVTAMVGIGTYFSGLAAFRKKRTP